jgi:WD40 repeat protein
MGPQSKTEKFNPFPGLRPFLPEESYLFFGREAESEEVIRKLLANRFITVTGASGSGKSSLVYCGVLPKLMKLADNASYSWKIVAFRPGNDPMGNLMAALNEAISGPDIKESVSQSVESVLKSDRDGISTIVKNMVTKGNDKVLIVVDQFEELFRYNTSVTGFLPGGKAATFVRLLENAVGQKEVEIYLVITLRSDFIGECAHFQEFTQLINNSNYLLPYMSKVNYKAVIEGPVKYAGASIDKELVETLLNDIGDRSDQLPVLQHTMMRTWSHWQELDEPDKPVSLSDYESVGSMSNAMSRHANEAFEDLGLRGREICEKIFKTITEKGPDNKGIRHPLSVKSIKLILQCTSEELFEVIEKFRVSSRSFITPRENIPLNEDSVIDLSHESLIRLWDRLKGWVDDEAAAIQMYLRLSEASAMYQMGKTTLLKPPDLLLALKWREEQKPTVTWAERFDAAFERAMVYLRTSEKEYLAEQENKIRLQKKQNIRSKIISRFLGGTAIIAIGLMLFAFVQKIAADRASDLAQKKRQLAERESHIADSLSRVALIQKIAADSDAVVARLREQEAVDQKNIAEDQRKIAFIAAREAQKQRNTALEQSDLAKNAVEKAAQNEITATNEKAEALRLRMLSVGKSMSLRSLQMQGNKDLQTLLAYQAYLFNRKNGGEPNDADIFSGLYTIAKQYGNKNYKTFIGHNGEVKSIAFVPGGREFFTAGSDGKLIRWDLDRKDQNLQVIYSGTEIIEVLAVSPDANWLACGGQNSIIKMIPVKTGNNVQYELKGHTDKVKSLVFSYDGKYLYSAALDGKVLKWDLVARTSVNVATNMMQINYIDISVNGNYLAGVSNEGKALIWDPEKNSNNFRIETPGKIIKAIKFKPDENTLAVGYTDGSIEFWDINERKKITDIKAHTADVTGIRFNKKLSQMATASNDGTLKLWNTKDLSSPPINFNDIDGLIMTIEFSQDGRLIVSGTFEGSGNLIGRPTNADIIAQDMCKTISRNLTADEWSAYVGKDIGYEKTCTESNFNFKVNEIR